MKEQVIVSKKNLVSVIANALALVIFTICFFNAHWTYVLILVCTFMSLRRSIEEIINSVFK